ncbi:unnamed protein product [Amoebophrya sp. A25]|nr:unnamed protein product [Amoebophrya sp. A25]|eukprot:GSA25T00015480001.1
MRSKEREAVALAEEDKRLLEETVPTEAEAEERLRAAFRDTLWFALYQQSDADVMNLDQNATTPTTSIVYPSEEISRGAPKHLKIGYAAIGCGCLRYPANLVAGHAFGGWMEVGKTLKGSLYPTVVTVEIRFGGDKKVFSAWKQVADQFLRRNVEGEHRRRVNLMEQKIERMAQRNMTCCGLFRRPGRQTMIESG